MAGREGLGLNFRLAPKVVVQRISVDHQKRKSLFDAEAIGGSQPRDHTRPNVQGILHRRGKRFRAGGAHCWLVV